MNRPSLEVGKPDFRERVFRITFVKMRCILSGLNINYRRPVRIRSHGYYFATLRMHFEVERHNSFCLPSDVRMTHASRALHADLESNLFHFSLRCAPALPCGRP